MSSILKETSDAHRGQARMQFSYLWLDLRRFLLLFLVFLRGKPALLLFFEFSLDNGNRWIESPLQNPYLQIEIFLVSIEYRPLRDIVTEDEPLLVLNECFSILVERNRHEEITRFLHSSYSARIAVRLRGALAVIELIRAFLRLIIRCLCLFQSILVVIVVIIVDFMNWFLRMVPHRTEDHLRTLDLP